MRGSEGSDVMNNGEKAPCSAVITGSSRGIGAAVAQSLAECGYNVCLNCSGEAGREALEDFARELSHAHGVDAIAVVADVSDATQAQALIDAALQRWGSVEVLVNNAGITRDGLIARMSEADFDRVVEVNLKSAFNCCKAAARSMMKRRYGRIVNMSSVVGLHGNAGQVNYAAAKAGLIGLTKALAKELAGRRITVNAVAPGFISTDMTKQLAAPRREKIEERIGLGRLGEPEDVAQAVRFFASEESGYITGQVLCVDGGLSL